MSTKSKIQRRLRAAVACAGLLLAVACSGSSSDVTGNTGTIRGTVTDVETGAPIPDANVRFGLAVGSTGADGTYLLQGVPEGGLVMTVDRDGYWQYNGWVVFVAANGVLVRDIAMTPNPPESGGAASAGP